jgi:hypothetical protein
MPRSRGRSAPAASRSAPSRSSHTMAAPAQHHAPPPPPPAAAVAQPQIGQQKQPGMFAQMASTAAGVAVGSAVGHTIANGVSGLFSGGSTAPAEAQPLQTTQAQEQQTTRACDVDARNFTKCLDENSGNMQICDWYLQQLKACQEAARNY